MARSYRDFPENDDYEDDDRQYKLYGVSLKDNVYRLKEKDRKDKRKARDERRSQKQDFFNGM
jgi:hypothetical protein